MKPGYGEEMQNAAVAKDGVGLVVDLGRIAHEHSVRKRGAVFLGHVFKKRSLDPFANALQKALYAQPNAKRQVERHILGFQLFRIRKIDQPVITRVGKRRQAAAGIMIAPFHLLRTAASNRLPDVKFGRVFVQPERIRAAPR